MHSLWRAATLALVLLLVCLIGSTDVQARPSTRRFSSAHATDSGVLSELDSTMRTAATSSQGKKPATKPAPGEHCFTSHLEVKIGTETFVAGPRSFCTSVVGALGEEEYENEAAFRMACETKFGAVNCKQQCADLARLYDQTTIGLQVEGETPYGLSRGNTDKYKLTQYDCEACMQRKRCHPRRAAVVP